jgi:uncharacterized protein YaaW (UPF0174 family)
MKNPVFDKDLTSLLKNCDNADLDPIVETIRSLPSETLTKRPAFIEHAGDHKAYVDEIVYEITSLGGNTLANLFRGQGVAYADMVRDGAKKLGIDETASDTVATLEEKMILRILHLGADEMSEDDRLALADLLAIDESLEDETGALETSEDEPVDEGEDEQEGGVEGIAAEVGEEFPEAEVSRRLADSATSLMGDRIFSAVEHVARTTRVRRALVGAAKAMLVKAVTAPLGGGVSWVAALGKGLHEIMGPNYTASLFLVAHIGLLRQKYEQIERDVSDEVTAIGVTP